MNKAEKKGEKGSLIIRRAEEKDIRPIALLETVCFSDPWSEDSVRYDVMENKLSFYLVAETEGRVAGYMGIWNIMDEGHITNVAVAPEYRRRHIASAMIEVMLEVTGESGIKRHTLEVRAGNAKAISLYEKYGFEIKAVRPGYYQDNGENAFIMWRESV